MGKAGGRSKGFVSVGDPKDPKAVAPVRMKKRVIDETEGDNSEVGMSVYMSLLAMLCGILGIALKWKAMAFQSIVFSLISFSNTKSADMDTKQVLSSLSIAVMALVMCYRQEIVG